MSRPRTKANCFCRKYGVYCRLANSYVQCKWYEGDQLCSKSYYANKADDYVFVHCSESCFECSMCYTSSDGEVVCPAIRAGKTGYDFSEDQRVKQPDGTYRQRHN